MLAVWNMSNEGKVSAGKYMKEFITFVKDKNSLEGGFERKGAGMVGRFNNYLNKLKECSYAYAELLNPEIKIKNNADWGTLTKRETLWKKVFLFKKTKATQHYPLYLALRFKNADIETVINYQSLIEKIYVNFILLSKKSPSLIEGEMSKMAYQIYKSDDIKTLYNEHLRKIKDFAKENKVKLEDFVEDFCVLTANNSVSSYLLLNIISNLDGIPPDITSTLTLEHVMPESAEFSLSSDNWYDENFLENGSNTKLNEETHKTFLHRVGNHTILKNADNIDLSNKSFEYKLSSYTTYGTDKITKGDSKLAVSNFSKWNSKSINERQSALQ